MTAQATPTVERLDMSDYEFEIPCDITVKSEPCGEPAVWIMKLRPHCDKGKAKTRLIGERCYGWVTGGKKAQCGACGEDGVVVRDYVLELERIKP